MLACAVLTLRVSRAPARALSSRATAHCSLASDTASRATHSGCRRAGRSSSCTWAQRSSTTRRCTSCGASTQARRRTRSPARSSTTTSGRGR
eukprot:418014-Rhodomonas_salina.1